MEIKQFILKYNFYLDEMDLIALNIKHSRDQRYTFYNCVGKDAYFKSQFARFKPFLWAQARFMMSKLIKPINNIVEKCITDGIITTQKLIVIMKWVN